VRSGRLGAPVQMVLEELSDYAKNHFEIEEGLMKKARYPHLLDHQKQHHLFLARIAEFPQLMQAATPDEALFALESLHNWLITHIVQVDKKYSDHLHASGLT
jgi:hemerythrin-like metal-binding protein